jgi:hypothetical protein
MESGMILADLLEFMDKNKVSKEQAIMTVLTEWAAANGVILTAVVAFQEDEHWAISTVATIPQNSPVEIIQTSGHLYSDMIQKILINQARSE